MIDQRLHKDHGKRLLKLARAVLECKLGMRPEVDRTGLEAPELEREGGTFVTLKRNKQLRGCIGNLEAESSIISSVEHNAIRAAFHDHRFSPLTSEELGKVCINISILSKPQPLEYDDGKELTSLLRPHIDGVVLRKGKQGATFLPQVWTQLPEPASFLEHLCQKAGLAASAWRTNHPDIYTYQVQYFEEESS